jgi:hypothetical protein
MDQQGILIRSWGKGSKDGRFPDRGRYPSEGKFGKAKTQTALGFEAILPTLPSLAGWRNRDFKIWTDIGVEDSWDSVISKSREWKGNDGHEHDALNDKSVGLGSRTGPRAFADGGPAAKGERGIYTRTRKRKRERRETKIGKPILP